MTPALVLALSSVLSLPLAGVERSAFLQPETSCQDWQACRDLAEQARANDEYETFHDLAWRAVQTRGRRDPGLFLLLARAQSLSGRPHDALVTLRRLATEMGHAADIGDDPDFRRVRALPGWQETAAAIAAIRAPAASEKTSPPAPPVPSAATAEPGRTNASTRETTARRTTPAAGAARRADSPSPDASIAAEFQAPPFTPGGLAYDRVSGRFVIGNLPERKLTIVAEGSNRAATLSGDAAQLRAVRAIAIDRPAGDLWVISAGPGNGADQTSSLHKLQLISGRVLKVYSLQAGEIGASLVDVSVSRPHGVLALDAGIPRLLRPEAKGDTLVPVASLPAGRPASLAVTGDGRTAYVAYDDRIVQLDLESGAASELLAPTKRTLAGFSQIRWHAGSLVGIQAGTEGGRLVRLRLRGRRVRAVEPLADDSSVGVPAAFDVVGSTVYYLVAGDTDTTVRRVRLR